MTEYVAHVNDNDEVIDIVPREVAAQKGYAVRIAAVLVFTTTGNIVLQKITATKKKDAGKWSYSAAGHVDAGEDYETATLRELKEELGIDGKIEDYIGLSRTIDPATNRPKAFHRAYRVIHDGPYTPDPTEAECIRTFSPTELTCLVHQHPEQFKQNLLDILALLGID